MNPTRYAAAAVLLAVVAPAARAADGPDPADLFPPTTLAYAELHDPAAFLPQVAAAVKGSVLADGLTFIHNRRDAARDPRDLVAKDELAVAALFTSPEMLAELRKVRGVAVGLTGFTDQGQPEYALVVVTGDSHAIGIAVRAYLTTESRVRRVGTVGAAKVPVYQFRTPAIDRDDDNRPRVADDRPTDGPHEPTLVYTPGLFVVGTSRAAVGEAVTRFLGETKGGLSGVPAFRAAAAAHRRPGVFFYADAAGLCARYDATTQARGEPDPDAYAWYKLVANAKAVRTVAGGVRFRDGGLSLALAADFDPARASPLLALLAAPGARAELLHPAPRGSAFAVAVALPEKDRAAVVVGFLDAVAKAGGQVGRLPGDVVREVEAKYKLSLRDGLLGRTRAVTVVFPVKRELPKGVRPYPAFVLHAETADVAAAWEEALPKIVAHLSGADAVPQPSAETVAGVRVLSLAGPGLPWNGPVHYARVGDRVAVGPDRATVAAAVAADPAASVVGGDRPAVIPPQADDLVLVGTASPGVLLGYLLNDDPDAPRRPNPDVLPSATRRAPAPAAGQPPDPDPAAEAKAWAALLAAFDTLPPATVTVRRSGRQLLFEAWLPRAADGGYAPVIDAGMAWLGQRLNRFYDPTGQPTRPLGGERGQRRFR